MSARWANFGRPSKEMACTCILRTRHGLRPELDTSGSLAARGREFSQRGSHIVHRSAVVFAEVDGDAKRFVTTSIYADERDWAALLSVWLWSLVCYLKPGKRILTRSPRVVVLAWSQSGMAARRLSLPG
ncbi:uncharacterized protein B0I36DRAFT_353338 [Microdochium trichocladiopsis]|uniref:Uncharacterized protein n=1 Tax=Microdochium trichocladiopsis TaxID=1682393 RepID=A0A9P9BJB8_9PEZI|nr:uncharacterized protein B0I36DRAFT_355348 [Microdochium trichocladiopsis]XP_046008739.1 uncharacterized protein B0I36DRAFT_353338 [Microdochium trichocladiopsis]KAH7016583.1 hypothetical protein B0I36DRAFT_355348 [Microdochium trichocladiopsis]KAH7025191.1 hypothetical protein B0I36DRAFT_353338 [Microdochium trichocladiopsis]